MEIVERVSFYISVVFHKFFSRHSFCKCTVNSVPNFSQKILSENHKQTSVYYESKSREEKIYPKLSRETPKSISFRILYCFV